MNISCQSIRPAFLGEEKKPGKRSQFNALKKDIKELSTDVVTVSLKKDDGQPVIKVREKGVNWFSNQNIITAKLRKNTPADKIMDVAQTLKDTFVNKFFK